MPIQEPKDPLTLDDFRGKLIRLEETIIFSLIERAQFKQNLAIYDASSPANDTVDYDGCFADYYHLEIEKVDSKVRRFLCPEEHPFFPSNALPDPELPPLKFPDQIIDVGINVNSKVKEVYRGKIIPKVCDPGDDQHYGSSATQDVHVLQALSKRIHMGQYIAEVGIYVKVYHMGTWDRLVHLCNPDDLTCHMIHFDVYTHLGNVLAHVNTFG
eukprot:TRINITY_DN2282_c0_g1_i1.p1 TRINITY_DN2282_c0_g1~~TRINITY_DN2282_c0_g1_i1.p1  ORF type:complete len:213 (+),score=28.19 TRINITY_DN2282_c0_g1_i1:36-674(+)